MSRATVIRRPPSRFPRCSPRPWSRECPSRDRSPECSSCRCKRCLPPAPRPCGRTAERSTSFTWARPGVVLIDGEVDLDAEDARGVVGDVRKPIGVLGSEGEGIDKAQASRILGFACWPPLPSRRFWGTIQPGGPPLPRSTHSEITACPSDNNCGDSTVAAPCYRLAPTREHEIYEVRSLALFVRLNTFVAGRIT